MFNFMSWTQHWIMYHGNGPDQSLKDFKKFVQIVGYLVRHDQIDINSMGLSCRDWTFLAEKLLKEHGELYDKIIGPQMTELMNNPVCGQQTNRMQRAITETLANHMMENASLLNKKPH